MQDEPVTAGSVLGRQKHPFVEQYVIPFASGSGEVAAHADAIAFIIADLVVM
jgi:hypothetical protein